MLTIFAIFTLHYELAIAQGELRYWDKQYDEMTLLEPIGIRDYTEYKNSELFYRERTEFLLNEINTIKIKLYGTQRIRQIDAQPAFYIGGDIGRWACLGSNYEFITSR